MKQRIVWIDWAKALCITLMIIGHTFGLVPELLNKMIYSFHMPAFFIISGYLFNPSKGANVKPLCKSLFMLFILIIILYGITNGFCYINEFYLFSYNGIENLMSHLWFVFVLVFLRLFFSTKLIKTKKIDYKIIGILFFFFSLFLYHTIGFSEYYIFWIIPSAPFFCLGMYLKGIEWTPNNISKQNLFIVTILFFIIGYINSTEKCCSMFSNYYGISYSLFFIGAVCGSFSIFYLCSKLPYNKVVINISIGTLLIYGLNGPLLKYIMSGVIQFFPGFLYNLFFIISSFLYILLCYPFILLSRRYFPVLLGKSR